MIHEPHHVLDVAELERHVEIVARKLLRRHHHLALPGVAVDELALARVAKLAMAGVKLGRDDDLFHCWIDYRLGADGAGRRRARRRCRAAGRRAAQEPPLDVVLARAADYVADYQTAARGHRRRRALPPERARRRRAAGDGSAPASSASCDSRPAARQARRRGVVDAVPRRLRSRSQADPRSRPAALQAVRRRQDAIARAQAETIQAGERALQHRPAACAPSTCRSWRCCSSSAPCSRSLTFERGEAGNVKRFAALADAADDLDDRVQETGQGTMVRGADDRDIPSHGRVWIDSATGRILRTELISEDTDRARRDRRHLPERNRASICWCPVKCARSTLIRRSETRIDGRATYSRFRQFTVTTSEKPKAAVTIRPGHERRRATRSGASFRPWSPAATPTRSSPDTPSDDAVAYFLGPGIRVVGRSKTTAASSACTS